MAQEPDPDRLIKKFPWGWIATYDDNEIEVVSTNRDPPKVRVAMAGEIESNLGAFSANIRRPDGRHEEYGIAMFRLTADRQEGAAYLGLRPRGQEKCKEFFYIDPHQAIFRVPIIAPNIGDKGNVHVVTAPGGQTELHVQGDGNAVMYDVRDIVTVNGRKEWAALSSLADGKIRDFREDGQYAGEP